MTRTIILSVFMALVIGFLIIGCVPAPTPEPQNPAEIAMTMAAQALDAQATEMKINMQYSATAQIIEVTKNVQNTQAALAVTEQARKDGVATDQQNRRDAAATEQQKRNDAAATEQRKREDAATEQARRDLEATAEQGRQNVIGTATAQQAEIWNGMTLAVAPTHDLLTLQAAHVEQTLAVNDAELSNLNVEQQTDKNTAEWVVPLLVALALVSVFAVVQIRRSRVQKVVNEEDGTVEGLLIDGDTLIRPQLMPGPVLDLSGKKAIAPDVTDPETQKEVTRRAQAIEALRAMPTTAPTANATLMANSVFGETKKPVIQMLQPGQGSASRVILDELSDQVVEEE